MRRQRALPSGGRLIVVLTCAVVLIGALVIGILRRVTPIIEQTVKTLEDASFRAHVLGLPAGAVVPAFMADTRSRRVLQRLRTSRRTLCHCVPRFEVLVLHLALRQPRNGQGSGLRHPSRCRHKRRRRWTPPDSSRWKPRGRPRPASRAVARIFETARTPHAFVLDSDLRVVTTGSPVTWDDVSELVRVADMKGG